MVSSLNRTIPAAQWRPWFLSLSFSFCIGEPFKPSKMDDQQHISPPSSPAILYPLLLLLGDYPLLGLGPRQHIFQRNWDFFPKQTLHCSFSFGGYLLIVCKIEAEEKHVPRRPNIMHKRRESSVPKRGPTLDPRMCIKAYKKEALLQRRAVELEEEAKKIDLDPDKLLKQGDPSSVQAVVKEVIPVGLFLMMPNGKEGFLPSTDFEFSGGVVVLRRLFKVGQVLTVKVLRHGGGREIVSMRKNTAE